MKHNIPKIGWTKLRKSFEETNYPDNLDRPFGTCKKTNAWNCNLERLSPDILELILNLNQRVEELEEKLIEKNKE